MEYLSVEQARDMAGLRLVLTRDVPGPWGESAKAVLRARNVPFVPVAQVPMAQNEALVAWTGIRNAPIAIFDEESPLAGWHDILLLAERLGEGPSLLPEDAEDRAACLAISHELCGADGFGWNRRLSIMAMTAPATPAADLPEWRRRIAVDYGATPETMAAAPGRVVAILNMLTERLEAQRAQGSDYLVGDRLSAADLYWACFSAMVRPLPQEVNPMPPYLRPWYETIEEEVAAALDPILIAHRDHVCERHIGLPLDY